MNISLGSAIDLVTVELLVASDPLYQPACDVFNFFFSITITAGLVAFLIKMIVRTLGRS